MKEKQVKKINISQLKKYIASGKQSAFLGAGHFGYAYFKIFEMLGIPVKYAADTNPDKWNNKIWGSVECHSCSIEKRADRGSHGRRFTGLLFL